jgi:putative transposase
MLGLSVRTVQRWRTPGCREDGRRGPRQSPSNALTEAEKQRVLSLLHCKEYRNLTPAQIVVQLADQGEFVASESTMYRLLRTNDELVRRDRTRPAVARSPRRHVATGPNHVWCWDITLLPSPWRGRFFYLYVVVDLFSRRVMGFDVLERESAKAAAALTVRLCSEHGVDPTKLVLHSDNGGAMKGATMLETLRWLGVTPSFSRPYVSDDNAYVESLFRTLKYRPGYPGRFESVAAVHTWAERFFGWYNTEHRHSGIRWVTPNERYKGDDVHILKARAQLYEQARQKNPGRWIGPTRNWTRPTEVLLNHSRPAQAA